MSAKGRPRVEERREAMVTLRVWPRLKAAVEAIAASKGVSVARHIEDLMIDNARKEGRWPTE